MTDGEGGRFLGPSAALLLLALGGCSPGSVEEGPAALAWVEGQLTIDLLRLEPDVRSVEGAWRGPDGAAALGPGERAEFLFEIPSPTQLVGQAESVGDGVLLIEVVAGSAAGEVRRERVDVTAGTASFEVDLSAAAGGPTRVGLGWLSDAGGAPVRLTRLLRVEPQPAPRPPIVFLSIDTLAAQSMSLYGYERATTPQLAAFAQECVVFERARANAPWTIPSYASQFTGQLSQSHHVGESGGPAAWERFVVVADRWTLPEAVRALGYETAAIYDNSWLGLVSGLLQGFDHVDGAASERSVYDLDGGMRTVFPRALEWIDGRLDRPFFAFVQILDAHGPYLPSRGFRGRFGSDRRGGEERPVVPSMPPTFGGVPDNIVDSLGLSDVDSVPIAPLRAAYDEKLAEVDAEVGRFLDELRKRPCWDELLIVISADHGESMDTDEHYFRHGALTQANLHVPLLVRLPRSERAGTRVQTPVDLLGLYPTLLELLGLSPERADFHGRSFAPGLAGAEPEASATTAYGSFMRSQSVELDGYKLVRHSPVPAATATILTHLPTLTLLLAEFDGLAARIGVPEDPAAALRVLARPGRLAAIEAGDPDLRRDLGNFLRPLGAQSRVYHLPSDPYEQHPLEDPPAPIVAALEAALARAAAQVAGARETGATVAPSLDLSPERKAELRALGYFEDE